MLKRVLLSTLLAALFAVNAFADDKPLSDGGVDAVLESQLDGIQAQPSVDAEEIVGAYQDKKKFWNDPEKGVIFGTGHCEVPINGNIADSNTFTIRDLATTVAILRARAEITASIASEMSASQLFNQPDNPVRNELPEETRQGIDAYQNKAMEIFSAHDKDDLVQQVEDGQLAGEQLIATLEQVATQDELEELKELQKNYIAGMKAASELQTELSSMENKSDLCSRMPIFGCTGLAQAESIIQEGSGKYKLKVAVLMVWSKKLQEGATAILEGKDVTYAPDKKGRAVREWLHEQDLSTILGSRQFIDKDGKMWFMGASSRLREGNTTAKRSAEIAAEMSARSNTVFSLVAESSMNRNASAVGKTIENPKGEEKVEAPEKTGEMLSASFTNVQINGVQKLFAREISHPLLNRKAYTMIYGVNTADVTALRSIRDNFYKTAKEVNTAQERERGKVAELEKQYEASKDNPQARAEGAAEAKQIMTAKPAEVIDAPAAAPVGKIRSGATTIKDNDDEDTF